MYYIYTINDISFDDINFDAKEIADYLLDMNAWIYTKRTPFINVLNAGDKVFVYLAGKGRRCFYACFELSEEVQVNNLMSNSRFDLISGMFKFKTQIENIQRRQNVIPIKEVLNELHFIGDKKNYGLYFRQSIKKIDEEDYLLLINKYMYSKILA